MSSWVIPTDLITRLATPGGMAAIVKAKLRSAVFVPVGRVCIRNDRFVGEIDFENPVGPEQQKGVVVALAVRPGEAFE